MNRRVFMKLTALLGTISAFPSMLIGDIAKRNDDAFDKVKFEDAIKSLYGTSKTKKAPEGMLKLKVLGAVENGAVVPVTVSSKAKNVESIALFAVDNPKALVFFVKVARRNFPKFSTRIRMDKTMFLIAVAKIGDELYFDKRKVRITSGGCS